MIRRVVEAVWRRRKDMTLPESWWREIPPEISAEVAGKTGDQRAAVVTAYADDAANQVAERLVADQTKILRRYGRLESSFNRNLRHRWAPALDAYRLTLLSAEETGDHARQRHASLIPSDPRIAALTGLHVQACMTAREILDLISHGYARGAAARWRTLHELAVTAFVLEQADPEISQRYLDHAVVTRFKDAIAFQEAAGRLGYEPFTDAAMQEFQSAHARAVEHWASPFEKENGWAAPLFGEKAPKFGDLEKRADLKHLRPYYRQALHGIHAGSRGAELLLIHRGEHDILLTGPINTGFAETAHAALISLLHVTMALAFAPVSEGPSLMALVLVRALDDLVSRAGDEFHRIETEIDAEERASNT